MRSPLVIVLAGVFAAQTIASVQKVISEDSAPAKCSLRGLSGILSGLPKSVSGNATILSAVHVVSGGSFGDSTPRDGLPAQFTTDLPQLCAVRVNVTSSKSSSYTISIFLPTKWNSRFLATGGSGGGGIINYVDMGAGSKYSFATMSTDNGHNSSVFDLSWAYGNPERLTDFGWRAMHGSVRLSKALISAYYKRPIRYSYYTGCSTGGRQGLKEAQISEGSFDGMLIGAPAWWSNHLLAWFTKISKDFYPADNPRSIPPELISLISATVVEQCDAIDGVKDGIISAPELCRPDLSVLLCNEPASSMTTCLTSLQLVTAGRIYNDYFVNSKLAHPGLEISSEAGWTTFLFGGKPHPFGIDFMRYAVFNDPNWPLEAYNDNVLALVSSTDPGNITADHYDMSPFRDRGGKIIMYHGLADPLIPARDSSYLIEKVFGATKDAAFGKSQATTDWFRLFLIPGLMHCFGTAVDAPWYINGAGQSAVIGSSAFSVPGFKNAKHDALLALMDWVEKGSEPNELIATSWKNMTNPSQGLSRQRPICPYPQRAEYKGFGNVDTAHSWTCCERCA